LSEILSILRGDVEIEDVEIDNREESKDTELYVLVEDLEVSKEEIQ
jgi:hypothetical protein